MNLKKWSLRIALSGVLMVGILVVLVLNPRLTYAYSTKHNGIEVLHNKRVNLALFSLVDSALATVKTSELYDPALELQLCLNDGSVYPVWMELLRGPAFAWGFANKVVLRGNTHYSENYAELHGYRWNLSQLIAHEAIHCYQFRALGLLKSAPLANIPAWKWEGYPEYIARQNPDQQDLKQNIKHFLDSNQQDDTAWAIHFEDGTMAPKAYYHYRLLVQYCLEVKGMSYRELLANASTEEEIEVEMMQWYALMHSKPLSNS
jgi:hypothetical protein